MANQHLNRAIILDATITELYHNGENGTIQIYGSGDEQYYIFSVEDDGPGIEPKYHQKIFEMFQTLKPRDEVEGSGMGLALIKKTLVEFGGSISVDSDLGRGTTFTFTWPKAKTSTQGEAA